MAKFKLPDLALKIDLARAAARISDSDRLQNQVLANCTFRRAMQNPAQTFSKAIVGDLYIHAAELKNLAAALEVMILGAPDGFTLAAAHVLADSGRELALYPKALLGTVQAFADALLELTPTRLNATTLAGIIRQHLALSEIARDIPMRDLTVVGVPDLEIAPSRRRRERDIDQPDRDIRPLKIGSPLQVYARPTGSHEVIIAYELSAGEALVSRPWTVKAPWLGVRLQSPNRPVALLDDNATVGQAPGVYRIHAVGVALPVGFKPPADATAHLTDTDLLPPNLLALARGGPIDWPSGYGLLAALPTFISRNLGEVRLHQGTYAVAGPTVAVEA